MIYSCGHVFVLRRTQRQRFSVQTSKLEKQSIRALEAFDDVIKRREQVRDHIALMRAKQTEQERASHRKSVKEHMVASRAKETDLERADRRKSFILL